MFKNIAEVKKFIKDENIEFVDFKLVDLRGRFRHLTIPSIRLNEKTMKEGIGFDASNYGYAHVEKSDMVFIPDLKTAVVDPFTKIKTLTMMANVYVIDNPNNKPFNQYPRNVVNAALDYMKKSKIADEMIIGPEYEFNIFDSMKYSLNPNDVSYRLYAKESEWSSNEDCQTSYHTLTKGGYHIDRPNDITFDVRNDICEKMKQFGIDVKYHHHEVGGSGQDEIEVVLDEMSKLADDTMLAKYIIKNCANSAGMTATLMPKPIYNEAGNGMHVHMLLKKNGKSIFYKEDNYANLSKEAMYFIGGILKHINSLCAFTNPTTNSYKRLVPGFEAPVTIGYASANRSSVIRIPMYAKGEENTRFELRNPDATCNPYYAYSAILMAGLDGIKNKIDPKDHNWGPFDFNLYELSDKQKAKLEQLPKNLDEAILALRKDYEYLLEGDVFSKELIENWIKAISLDADKINRIPHPAEFELYYDL